MQHKGYPEVIEVGCICAGVMEGDILAAKDRERECSRIVPIEENHSFIKLGLKQKKVS
jgi:hypothetical protein